MFWNGSRTTLIISSICIGLVLSACGQEESSNTPPQERQADTEQQASLELSTPAAAVGNEEGLLAEYGAMPDAILEAVPLDAAGNEITSEAQFRSYSGQHRPTSGRDAHRYYQNGHNDGDRLHHYRHNSSRDRHYGSDSDEDYRRRGHDHPYHDGRSDYHHNRHDYRYRPHYRSHVHDHHHWVYNNPLRYVHGDHAYYWYPKPTYRYQHGRCHNYYTGPQF